MTEFFNHDADIKVTLTRYGLDPRNVFRFGVESLQDQVDQGTGALLESINTVLTAKFEESQWAPTDTPSSDSLIRQLRDHAPTWAAVNTPEDPVTDRKVLDAVLMLSRVTVQLEYPYDPEDPPHKRTRVVSRLWSLDGYLYDGFEGTYLMPITPGYWLTEYLFYRDNTDDKPSV